MKAPRVLTPTERRQFDLLKRVRNLSARDLAERAGSNKLRIERMLRGDVRAKAEEIDGLRVALGLGPVESVK